MTPRQLISGPGHPLPLPVRPYQDETTRSYIRRINNANALTHGELVKMMRKDHHPWMYDLAIWNDTRPEILELALPQLAQYRPDAALRQKLVGRPIRTTHSPACHHCTLSRGAGPYVEVYTTHERVICPDHGLWIGEGAGEPAAHFSISVCPEIMYAWHHHRNLITRHGHAQVRRAFHIASVINCGWYDQFQHFSTAIENYEALTTEHPRQANSPALVAAALYPSIVTLTAAIAHHTGGTLPAHAILNPSLTVSVTKSPTDGNRRAPSIRFGIGWRPIGRQSFADPTPSSQRKSDDRDRQG